MKLKDQVAIITGAGRNIGEDVAKLFSAEGAKIAVVDLDRPRGQRTVDAIKETGGDAELYVTDVSKGADVEAMVKAVVGRFGRVDILVNNVAVSDNKTIFECTEEDWDRVMTVTLKSQFLMSKHVAQQMVAQGGGGKIVNVGSTSGWQGRPRAIAYSAAKAAIANFTRALAVQLAPHNIRVNAIVPTRSARRSARTSSIRRARSRTCSSVPVSRSRRRRRSCSWSATTRPSSSARTCSSTAAPWRWTRREV